MNQPVAVFNTKTLYTKDEFGLSSANTYSSDDRKDTTKTFVLIKSFETERASFTPAEKAEMEHTVASPVWKLNVFGTAASNDNY
jgi:hypothetical protein